MAAAGEHGSAQRIEALLKLTATVYRLPVIRYQESVSSEFFARCQRKSFFVVAALFDRFNRLFLFRDFGKTYGYAHAVVRRSARKPVPSPE